MREKYNVEDYLNPQETRIARIVEGLGLGTIIAGIILDYTPLSVGGSGILVGAVVGEGIAHFRAYSKMMADYMSNLDD